MEQNTLINFRKKEIVPRLKKETFDYKVFEVTPSRFIESGKSIESILDTIHAISEGKVKYDYLNKNIVINQSSPIYYEILFEGKNIKFNYVIPDKYTVVLVNKIDKVFRVAAVKEIEDYFPQFVNKYYCTFSQKKHFMFSLNSNYTDNTGLLDNLLSVINSVLPEDKVLLQLGVLPLHEKWKENWGKANIKHKNGEELPVHPSTIIAVAEKLIGSVEGFLDLLDVAIGVDKKEKEAYSKKTKQVEKWGNNVYRNAHMSTQKVTFNGFETQIRVYCTSEERTRYYQKTFSGVFKILDGEQELEFIDVGKHKGNKREFIKRLTGKNIFCTKELVSFLKLPDRRMQMDFKSAMKNTIENTENKIPIELREGGKIKIGDASFKGTKIPTYFPTEYSMNAIVKVIVAPVRAGKTEKTKHFILEAIKAGDSVICIDTIKNCEIVEDVRDHMPEEFKDKLVILDYSNIRQRLPLDFNELLNVETKDHIDEMMLASHLTSSLCGFVNAVSGFDSEGELKPRMKRFLSIAGKIVLSQKGSTLKDVFDVLQEFDIREKFIKSSGLPETNSMIQQLRLLDDGKGGTNYSMVSGILDRASAIMNDYISETLLSTPSNPEINFTKFANEGKCVLIKMSDSVFDLEVLKPMVTFMYFKIWLALATARSKTKNPRMCHVILDEIHRLPEVASFLSSKAKESPKFGLSYVITSHYLPDMKRLLPNLKSAQANFMFLGGASKENFKLLETELMQGNISIEEAMETKPFHALNIINFNREYAIFTTKSYPEWKKCGWLKKVDRSYLDLEHSMKYGLPFEG